MRAGNGSSLLVDQVGDLGCRDAPTERDHRQPGDLVPCDAEGRIQLGQAADGQLRDHRRQRQSALLGKLGNAVVVSIAAGLDMAALSRLFPGERLVIPAGTPKVRSNDTDYRFRPHSAFAHVTGMGIQWAYLSTDLVVLGLSLTYIPLRRIGYSLLTVLISGQLIGLVQRLPLPWDKPRPEAAE